MQDEIEARELREEDIAPEDASEQPARFVHRHPLAAALAILVGAAALVGGGFAAGTVYGERLVAWLFPSVVAVRDEPVTEQVELEDGYGGALARRVSAAAGDVAANAYEPPTLDEATAGAIEGLLAKSGISEATRRVVARDADAMDGGYRIEVVSRMPGAEVDRVAAQGRKGVVDQKNCEFYDQKTYLRQQRCYGVKSKTAV